MSNASSYDALFYRDMMDGARRSASIVVPRMLRFLPFVKSVIDFGCGAGVWLREFQLAGLDIAGYDFGAGATENLVIPKECFNLMDFSAPITLERKCDLAVSLVAEHIPSERSDMFIALLVNAADVILFSAAIPGQGGTDHCNEQWPSYWIEKFAAHSFECLDVLRPMFWYDTRIEWWYRQNIMFFVRDKTKFIDIDSLTAFFGYPLVHPNLMLQYQEEKSDFRNQIGDLQTQLAECQCSLQELQYGPYASVRQLLKSIWIILRRIKNTLK